MKWMTPLAACRPRVFITHGEDTARKALSELIRQRLDLQCQLPSQGSIIEISESVIVSHDLAS